jgi:protein-S-isoprenylcysteine O-methyltransferase Ste14
MTAPLPPGPAPAPAAGASSGPQARVRPLVASGRFFFRTRDVVLPVMMVALALLTVPRTPAASGIGSGVLVPWGIAVSVLGQLWRALCIGIVYIQRGGKNRRPHADELVTDGFFSVCRNPLYVGNFGIQLGLLMVLDTRLGYAVGVPFIVWVYTAIVAAEEDFLRPQFGAAYDAYCRAVHRWLPNPAKIPAACHAAAFDVRRVLRKEYGSTAAWMTMCCALLAWRRVRQGAADPVAVPWPVLGAAWGAVLLAYAVVRTLKKTRRLRSN